MDEETPCLSPLTEKGLRHWRASGGQPASPLSTVCAGLDRQSFGTLDWLGLAGQGLAGLPTEFGSFPSTRLHVVRLGFPIGLL